MLAGLREAYEDVAVCLSEARPDVFPPADFTWEVRREGEGGREGGRERERERERQRQRQRQSDRVTESRRHRHRPGRKGWLFD